MCEQTLTKTDIIDKLTMHSEFLGFDKYNKRPSTFAHPHYAHYYILQ
jgi:hypothetical protein